MKRTGLGAFAICLLLLLGLRCFGFRVGPELTILGGLDSTTRVDAAGSGDQQGLWPTSPPRKFATEIVSTDPGTGIETLKIKALVLQQTTGGLGNFYSFSFYPTGAFSEVPPDGAGGTASLESLIAYRHTASGHFWTEPFVIRATRNTALGPQGASHYLIRLTTDETGAFPGHAALPTSCPAPVGSQHNPFQIVANGKPFGVTGPSPIGTPIGPGQMILAAAGCPVAVPASPGYWPASDTVVGKTGVILNLVATLSGP